MNQPPSPMLRLTAFALLLALGLAAGAARAQMRSPDANGDGVISRAESKTQSDARFDRMDANHDGVIDAGELAAARKMVAGFSPRMAAMVDRMDINHDGKVTRAEAAKTSEANFTAADSNRDGKLDKGELEAVRKALGGD